MKPCYQIQVNPEPVVDCNGRRYYQWKLFKDGVIIEANYEPLFPMAVDSAYNCWRLKTQKESD